jgi:glycosyltransferase involved in cell wall biosynthesis
MPFGTGTRYALAPLARMFYEVGVELAGGDPGLVHFGYPNFQGGHPRALPENFRNFVQWDFRDMSAAALRRVAGYARSFHIRTAMIFDIQPVNPVFRRLHEAGVRTVLAYWGAPICSLMPGWRLAIKRVQFALARSKADGLIFESQAMAELAIYGRGVPPHMIDVVPLGVDTGLFRPGESDYVYEALGLRRDRKVVIYAGHMEKRKGVRTLIEAAIELLGRRGRSDVCFLLFGNQGDQSREFEQMYAGSGFESLIRFGGYRSDLAKIYPGCFCGVIPSTGWDSYTCSALEMAACGLPVVASRLQGLCEAVLDGKTGVLFPPGDSQALADVLANLLDHPQLAREYGAQGRRRCETELTLQHQKQRLISVLHKRLS